jgi:hypothetical protein
MWINRGNLKISTPKLMDKQHRPKLSSTATHKRGLSLTASGLFSLITTPPSRGE